MASILYVGMDVHSTNYTLCTYSVEDDKEFALAQFKPDHLYILRYIKRLKEQYGEGTKVICGYKPGGLGYSLNGHGTWNRGRFSICFVSL